MFVLAIDGLRLSPIRILLFLSSSHQSGVGDPMHRIGQLETILGVERASNSELTQRLQLLAGEAEKLRTQAGNAELQMKQEYAELQAQHRALTDTHAQCLSTHQALSERIAAMQRHQTQSDAAVRRYEADLARMVETISEQSARLQSLEAAAAATAASSSGSTEEALRLAKVKVAKSKDQLKQKESQIGALLEELATTRGSVAAAERKERDANARMDAAVAEADRLRAEVTKLQQQTTTQQQQQSTSRKHNAGEGEAKRSNATMTSAEKKDWEKQRREWERERVALQKDIGSLRQSLALAQSPSKEPPSARVVGRAQEEALQEAQHRNSQLLAELREARHAADQSNALAQQLRHEHSKVAGALNKLMASGGGGPGGGTITIASKKGMFPEYVAVKRENERLHQQVADLQQTIHMINTRAAQAQVTIHSQAMQTGANNGGGGVATAAGATAPPTTTTSNIQQLARVASRPPGPAAIPPLQPSRSVSGLQLIAAHEAAVSASSASSSALASPIAGQSTFTLPSTTLVGAAGHGSAAAAAQRSAALANMTTGTVIGRRSSGGWATSGMTTTAAAGANAYAARKR